MIDMLGLWMALRHFVVVVFGFILRCCDFVIKILGGIYG